MISKSVVQLPEPCWVVTRADGETLEDHDMYGETHNPTEAEALEELAGYVTEDRPAAAMTVTQNEVACTEAFALCGERFVYYGDSEEVHFPDEATVVMLMLEDGMVEVSPGLFASTGSDCAECKEAIADRPAPELPGQLGLHDGGDRDA